MNALKSSSSKEFDVLGVHVSFNMSSPATQYLKAFTLKLSLMWLVYWLLVNTIIEAQGPIPQPNESFCVAMDPPPGNYKLQTSICKQFIFYRWMNRSLVTVLLLGNPRHKIKLAMIQVRVNDTPVGTFLKRKGLNHISCLPGKMNVAYYCNMLSPYYFVIAKWVPPVELVNTNFSCRIHVTTVENNSFWKMTEDVVPFPEFKVEKPPMVTLRYLN